MLAVASLLFLGGLGVRAFIELWLFRAAVPTEFGQHHWLAGPGHFANDAFQIGEVGQFVLLAPIFVPAALGGIKVNLQEIQKLCLPLRAVTGVIVNAAPKARGDGGL